MITVAVLESAALADLPLTAAMKTAMVRASVQPDLMRPREMPKLRAVEAPQHFIDLELLQGEPLPAERWEYVRLLNSLAEKGNGPLRADRDVSQAGTAPYAIAEGTRRLAAIFAQLRRRPEDEGLQFMAAHQAGFVAHYAEDLCQPLHTTVHHDGRVRRNGSSPGTGIHGEIDALMLVVNPNEVKPSGRSAEILDPLFPAILTTLHESHSQVDGVYELTQALTELDEEGRPPPELVSFASQRFQYSVNFTSDLIYTAWHLSASIDLPGWASRTYRD